MQRILSLNLSLVLSISSVATALEKPTEVKPLAPPANAPAGAVESKLLGKEADCGLKPSQLEDQKKIENRQADTDKALANTGLLQPVKPKGVEPRLGQVKQMENCK